MRFNMFILKNSAKLGLDNTKLNINDWIGKLQEEFTETKIEAEMYRVFRSADRREKLVSEILDTIQVCIAGLDMLEKENADIKQAIIKHNTKLLSEREWTINKNINIEVSEVE